MPITHSLIASSQSSSNISNLTFNSIPNTYTDLKLVISARSNRVGADEDSVAVAFNDGQGATSWILLFNSGNNLNAGTSTSLGYGGAFGGRISAANSSTQQFGSLEMYIPNYAASANKTFATTGGVENSPNTPYSTLLLSMRTLTSAIGSIYLAPGNGTQFLAYSSFYLYGIKKA
jgi:hypothetical protein